MDKGFLTCGQKLGLFLSRLRVKSDFLEPIVILFRCPIKKAFLELEFVGVKISTD